MQTLWSDDRLPAKDVRQVPKTQEWGQHWGGLKRNGERALRHSHTYTPTRTCIQNADRTSRRASKLQTLHHRITWPSEALYTTCSLCFGPIQFAGLFVCYFHDYGGSVYISAHLTKLTPLIWLTSTSLSANNQWLAAVWSLAVGFFKTLLLTKGQKHHKGLRDSVCISAKGLYLGCWLNKTLTDSTCPFSKTIPTISHLISDHHLSRHYRSYICSDMEKAADISFSATVCTHLCCVRAAGATRYLRWLKDIALYLR